MLGLNSIGGIFTPEISPIHKRVTSIACKLILTQGELTTLLGKGNTLLAGSLLYSKTAGSEIQLSPLAGCTITKGTENPTGVLYHDIALVAGQLQYQVGVLVDGIVYEDVMQSVNKASWTTEKPLLEDFGIAVYAVKTLKK